MMAQIEKYMTSLKIDIGNCDFKEFDGTEFKYYHGSYNYGYRSRYNHWLLDYEKFRHGNGYNYYIDFDEKFEPAGPIRECSTCLMFEYFNELWGVVLDVDDYADYCDPSYGLDGDDETDFEVHDRLIGKRLRRYLKME